MSTNLTESFLDNIISTADHSVSSESLHQARRCLLDYLGVSFAGAYINRERCNHLANLLGRNSSEASLIGLNKKSSLLCAALINGISSHTAELDDGVISGIIHPGTPIFSALLPIAQIYPSSGIDFLRATLVGYEVAVRIANTIQPSHKSLGYHATATCGSLGATVAIGILRGFTSEQIKHSFSAAAVSAGGSLAVLDDNSELKPYNPGHAATSAITACMLSESGFIGPEDILSGSRGFINMMSEKSDLSFLHFGNVQNLCISEVYFKPYAACRYCHPAIECILSMDYVNFDDICRIDVYTYDLAVQGHEQTDVQSISASKMSIPFSIATSLVNRSAGVASFSAESLNDPTIKRLASSVAVHPDDSYSRLFPDFTSARVEIFLKDGSVLTAETKNSKGDPENPMSDYELLEKFRELASFAEVTSDRIDLISQSIWSDSFDINYLITLL